MVRRPNFFHYYLGLDPSIVFLNCKKTHSLKNLSPSLKESPERKKLIQFHFFSISGSFATATCLKCQASYAGSAIQADVLAGRVVLCTICNQKRPIEHEQEKTVPKPKKKKKKKSNDGEEGGWGPGSSEEKEEVAGDWISKGVVKPDITFFVCIVFFFVPCTYHLFRVMFLFSRLSSYSFCHSFQNDDEE